MARRSRIGVSSNLPQATQDRLLRLLQYVHEHPDCSGTEVAHHLRVTVAAVLYHLPRLEKWGLMQVRRSKGTLALRALGHGTWKDVFAAQVAAQEIQHPLAQQILQLIHKQPGLNANQIGQQVKTTKDTARLWMTKLQRRGLIEIRPVGRILIAVPPGQPPLRALSPVLREALQLAKGHTHLLDMVRAGQRRGISRVTMYKRLDRLYTLGWIPLPKKSRRRSRPKRH